MKHEHEENSCCKITATPSDTSMGKLSLLLNPLMLYLRESQRQCEGCESRVEDHKKEKLHASEFHPWQGRLNSECVCMC